MAGERHVNWFGDVLFFPLGDFSLLYLILIAHSSRYVITLSLKKMYCILEHSSIQNRLDPFVLFHSFMSCKSSLYSFELKGIKYVIAVCLS